MAVKLISGLGHLSPLTSPPPAPDPIPAADLIHKVMDYQDRKVWVTIPFPDKISLITDITNEIQAVPDQSGKSLKQIYHEFDDGLVQDLKATPLVEGGPISLAKHVTGTKANATFLIKYAGEKVTERASFVLQRREGPDFPIWSARLEFNPFKAGPAGLAAIRDAIEYVAVFIDFDKMLGSLQITRLDAAIDCIGAQPIDLIARIPKPGKRLIYASDSGVPETIYFYERKPDPFLPPKTGTYRTVGPMRMKLYERTSYQRQLGEAPTYGECPVTRAEVTKKWTKVRPMFADLATVGNLFEDRIVAYAAAALPMTDGFRKRTQWRMFCMVAFSIGARLASLRMLKKQGVAFAKLLATCGGDLVAPGSWSAWQDGLDYSGLSGWVKIAAQTIDADPTVEAGN